MILPTKLCIVFLTLSVCVFTLVSCTQTPPPCPIATEQPNRAPSAGCLVINNNKVLMVQGANNAISFPGGSRERNELTQCTAHRETWEETGLDVRPQALIREFDTGFYLFRCDLHANSGEIDPPFRMEIKNAYWLAEEEFSHFEWRFPEQQQWLMNWLNAQR